jgi:TAP-like protein
MLSALVTYDVTDLATRIACPALVLHRRGDAVVPVDGGRQFAALIPGARLVTLEGRNHVPMPEEPETAQFLELIAEFAGGSQRRVEKPAAPAASGLVTILFTDMEGSTAGSMAAERSSTRGMALWPRSCPQ